MIQARGMLREVAQRYAREMEGPARRRQDAQALLRMWEALDEEGARVYLERFVAKWRVEHGASAEEQVSAGSLGLVRRRPMTELERHIYEELARGLDPLLQRELSVEVEESSRLDVPDERVGYGA